ncbi:MAPEG family protein [Sphingomonas astaxanthinifaciens]|uniref:Membrane protein n=1 Tax=Sphingomonas astaxanthinifaciens DSM 22298 TaxID=1123267 RepID=A0ABQ5ZAC3_9SPHN|nr:MAPEG family protein [Sphingomonas astaxanthinifaciens]GLR47557.1 membrane protein [Sphingomonas astaxanthinifaciens DSM 22298]
MPTEYVMLAVLILLALVNILWAGAARTRQYGSEWNMGARDEKMPPLHPFPARLLRAQANLFETLPLFVAALLGAAAAGHFGPLTHWGSIIYVAARIVYLPLYAAGVPKFRTLIFLVSLIGLLMVWAALLFG